MLFWLFLILLFGSLAYAALSLAPWVPTRTVDLPLINTTMELAPGQTMVEFGCGTAKVSTYIAQQNPQAQVIGVELAWPLWLYSWLKQKLTGPANLRIVFGNALKYDLSNVDVVYVFGLIETLNKPIKTKITNEMKQGARLVSYVFSLKKWSGQTRVHRREGDPHANPVNVYRR